MARSKLKVVSKPVAPLLKLDLGSGDNVREGFMGIDFVATEGVKKSGGRAWDLKKTPWPWKDESVIEVNCSHFLEHLTGLERIPFMDELYRVLAFKGTALIITPYWSSMRAVQDPTHQWPPICEASYLYFNKPWRITNKLDHYGSKADFDYTYGYQVDGMWVNRNQETRDFAIRNYVNSIMDLHVTLVKNPR